MISQMQPCARNVLTHFIFSLGFLEECQEKGKIAFDKKQRPAFWQRSNFLLFIIVIPYPLHAWHTEPEMTAFLFETKVFFFLSRSENVTCITPGLIINNVVKWQEFRERNEKWATYIISRSGVGNDFFLTYLPFRFYFFPHKYTRLLILNWSNVTKYFTRRRALKSADRQFLRLLSC